MKHYLYQGNDDFAWHARRWPQFDEYESPEQTLIIQPVYSISDWCMGRPLDSEEVVGSAVLDKALDSTREDLKALVLPPIRYSPRQSSGSMFHLDIEAAHQVLIETIRSAAVPGFKRFVLFNTSPFLEEWIDVAARDLRVVHDLQMFCMNLSGVGLDFHPTRGGDRSGLDSILTDLLGEAAEVFDPLTAAALDPIVGSVVKMNNPLAAHPEGATVLFNDVVESTARLLREINTHASLKNEVLNKEETE
jgi:creatinine amidohydrolase/Fe(II)-dependent formamide hydrolase-like protein